MRSISNSLTRSLTHHFVEDANLHGLLILVNLQELCRSADYHREEDILERGGEREIVSAHLTHPPAALRSPV